MSFKVWRFKSHFCFKIQKIQTVEHGYSKKRKRWQKIKLTSLSDCSSFLFLKWTWRRRKEGGKEKGVREREEWGGWDKLVKKTMVALWFMIKLFFIKSNLRFNPFFFVFFIYWYFDLQDPGPSALLLVVSDWGQGMPTSSGSGNRTASPPSRPRHTADSRR